MKSKDPCKAFACRIQDCLTGHNYQEDSCRKVIEEMKDCCRTWGERSFVCNGFKLDETKVDKTKNKVNSKTSDEQAPAGV